MINNTKILIDRDCILLTEKLDTMPIYREVKAGELMENDEFSFSKYKAKKPNNFFCMTRPFIC